MTLIQAIVLGIIEGITEFLPVSSTGHLILASSLLGISSSEFLKTFEIAIQSGAIFSVIVLYWRTFLYDWETNKRIAAAFLPTALLGLLLYSLVKSLLDNTSVVAWSLLVGGIALIIFEYWHKEKENSVKDIAHMPYRQALAIGCFQAVAFIPGISRSAATIVGGLLMGVKRTTIVEFSFLLAVPTMIAATGLDLIKNAGNFSSNQALILAVGFIVSFIVAAFAIKLLLQFVKHYTFVSFGVYRIIIALLFLSL